MAWGASYNLPEEGCLFAEATAKVEESHMRHSMPLGAIQIIAADDIEGQSLGH